jgi:hypothetical protein
MMDIDLDKIEKLMQLMDTHKVSSLKIGELQLVKAQFSVVSKTNTEILNDHIGNDNKIKEQELKEREDIEHWSLFGGRN